MDAENDPRLALTLAVANTSNSTTSAGLVVKATGSGVQSIQQSEVALSLAPVSTTATTDVNGNFTLYLLSGFNYSVQIFNSDNNQVGSFQMQIPKMSRKTAATFNPTFQNLSAGIGVYFTGVTVNATSDYKPPSVLPAGITSSSGGASSVIRVYSNAAVLNGAIGNRAATSTTCQNIKNATYPGFSCSTFLALVSYNGDVISDFPTHHGLPSSWEVISHNGTQLAVSWADFLDGPTNSLQSADVFGGSPPVFGFWTFATVGGGYDLTNNCSAGTASGPGVNGAIGEISATADSFISNGSPTMCSNDRMLACVCWQ